MPPNPDPSTDTLPTTATATSPGSIGNVAVGYDVLGGAFDAVHDRVRIERIETPTVEIASITGCVTELPRRPKANTATVGLLAMHADRDLSYGFRVHIHKGIPLSSGMGGSAASAVAAMKAAQVLVDPPLTDDEVLHYALQGEQIASGAMHGDNVVPMVYGGVALTRSLDPLDVVPIPVPEGLHTALAHPHMQISTRSARAVLPEAVPVPIAVQQSANLAALVAGCAQNDLPLIGRSLHDVMIEPHRARLIPGFDAVQAAAREAGALGGSISGAGPSVFAWCPDAATAERVGTAMRRAFAIEDLDADIWTAPVASNGAQRIDASTET
ncbi:homoserine kinase [Longimonas halophila]|uniref:Homoserine kinase n=1 Tax=Longimonas halophila TaxID=1469170 RepID=A0A2H3P3U4_9BACT|nr:homoserine kinase [Longimonas halophila]PEN05012.1 homoserine kinase [Longimonas halophila]